MSLRFMKALLPFLAALLPAVADAGDAEAIFADAAEYTLRVDVTVRIPFVEDQRGAHFGAAFIVDSERRWAITNAHVATRSPARLRATLLSGERVAAERVYVDPYVDIAVLALDGNVSQLPEAELSCSGLPGVGHPVGAYGHPWGFDFTGTQGVISGAATDWGPTMIQMDTPINGGNSGGPLISLETGKVVGVNRASFGSEQDQNTNFAVPARQVCRILELLEEGKDPSPAQLDTVFYDVRAGQQRLTVARTYLDEALVPLREEDRIVAVNGAFVANESDLQHELRGSLDDVVLTVKRHGETLTLRGRLRPEPSLVDRQGLYFSGILFADSGFRDRSSVDAGAGIMVHSLEPGSEADGEGLIPFDYLVRVDDVAVSSLEELHLMLSTVPPSGEVQLDFMRLVEDKRSGHLFYSVRRTLTRSDVLRVGDWDTARHALLQTRE